MKENGFQKDFNEPRYFVLSQLSTIYLNKETEKRLFIRIILNLKSCRIITTKLLKKLLQKKNDKF